LQVERTQGLDRETGSQVEYTDHTEMVANILDKWEAATDEQRQQGMDWYPTFGRMISTLAHDYGFEFERAAGAFAWLSPRVTVARNIEMFVQLLSLRRQGINPFEARKAGYTWSMYDLLDKADRVLLGDLSSLDMTPATRPRKVRSFYRNLIGNTEVVTVDVWAARAAMGPYAPERLDGGLYKRIEHAYQVAARVKGVTPRDMQAVVWVVTRGSAD
jgi:hypothetical protein